MAMNIFRVNEFIVENYTNQFSSFQDFELKIHENNMHEKSHIGVVGLPIEATIAVLAEKLGTIPAMTIQQIFSRRNVESSDSIGIFIDTHRESMEFELVEKILVRKSNGYKYENEKRIEVELSTFIEKWKNKKSSQIFLNSCEEP
jgi:hypothetical protein